MLVGALFNLKQMRNETITIRKGYYSLNLLPDTIDFPILIKISKKKYLKEIQNGKLYMNNLGYFVSLEKTTGVQGIGDIKEASLCNIQKHKLFVAIDGEAQKEVDISPPPGIIYDSDALHHPVFCLMGKTVLLKKNNVSQYIGVLKLNEDEMADFLGDIDSCAALIIFNTYEFMQRVENAAKKQNLLGKAGVVNYRDMRFPNIVGGNWILDNTFTKDIRFQKQSEFRIELFNHSNDAIIFDIGDLHNVSAVIECEKLLSGLTIIQEIEMLGMKGE